MYPVQYVIKETLSYVGTFGMMGWQKASSPFLSCCSHHFSSSYEQKKNDNKIKLLIIVFYCFPSTEAEIIEKVRALPQNKSFGVSFFLFRVFFYYSIFFFKCTWNTFWPQSFLLKSILILSHLLLNRWIFDSKSIRLLKKRETTAELASAAHPLIITICRGRRHHTVNECWAGNS